MYFWMSLECKSSLTEKKNKKTHHLGDLSTEVQGPIPGIQTSDATMETAFVGISSKLRLNGSECHPGTREKEKKKIGYANTYPTISYF